MELLEWGVAAAPVAFAWQLPAHSDVDQTFDLAGPCYGRTGSQVKLFPRGPRPAPPRAARPRPADEGGDEDGHRHAEARRSISTGCRRSATPGDVAGGLDGLGDAWTATTSGRWARGSGRPPRTSTSRWGRPPAGPPTASMNTADLCDDAPNLSVLLRRAPPDLKAAKEIYDGLGRFGEGLDKM